MDAETAGTSMPGRPSGDGWSELSTSSTVCPMSMAGTGPQWLSTIGFVVGSEIELIRLEGEVDPLCDKLETRKLAERAKGIIQREPAVDEKTAYLTLQKQCRQRRLSMKKIAEAIVLADEVKRTQNGFPPQ